jgi:hypothetical protein
MKAKMFYLALVMALIFNCNVVFGEEVTSENTSENKEYVVEITQENFPDSAIRDYINRVVDDNKDGYLQQEEINQIEKIDFNNFAEDSTHSRNQVINCKGLEYFTNLKNLILVAESTYGGELINLKYIYNISSLEELSIGGANTIKKIDLSKLNNLEKLYVIKCDKLKEISLPSDSKLTVLYINSCNNLKKINLSGLKKLNDVKIFNNEKLSQVVLPAKNKIETLNLSDNNIKKIDVKGRKITTLVLTGNKIKKLNLKNCKNVKKVYVNKKTKIVKNKNQKIKIRRGVKPKTKSWYSIYYSNIYKTR